jgi:hypothetical protein
MMPGLKRLIPIAALVPALLATLKRSLDRRRRIPAAASGP